MDAIFETAADSLCTAPDEKIDTDTSYALISFTLLIIVSAFLVQINIKSRRTILQLEKALIKKEEDTKAMSLLNEELKARVSELERQNDKSENYFADRLVKTQDEARALKQQVQELTTKVQTLEAAAQMQQLVMSLQTKQQS
eukprot:Colp12_sorted_trinity150504_noHs@15936